MGHSKHRRSVPARITPQSDFVARADNVRRYAKAAHHIVGRKFRNPFFVDALVIRIE